LPKPHFNAPLKLALNTTVRSQIAKIFRSDGYITPSVNPTPSTVVSDDDYNAWAAAA
jgi:hypothetical protein